MTIKEKTLKKLLGLPNVNGAFEGDRTTNGKKKGKGIVVTVSKKLPRSQMKKKDLVPREIDGQKVDVIEIGELKALGVKGPSTVAPQIANKFFIDCPAKEKAEVTVGSPFFKKAILTPKRAF